MRAVLHTMNSRYTGLDLSTLESDVYNHREFELLAGMGGDVIHNRDEREHDEFDDQREYNTDRDSEIIIDDEDEELAEEEGDEEKEIVEVDVPLGFVRMRPSKFNFIPASVFFEYPKELNMVRKDVSTIDKMGRKSLNYSCQWGRNCIKNAFKRAGFNDDTNNWTAMWSKHQAQETIKNMNCLQKVNHFPASWCIGRKDRLMRTIHTMRRLHPDEFNFHPEGFILPSDNFNLERVLKADAGKMRNKNDKAKFLWIIKPVASSCGKGIKVISHDKALALCKEKKKLLVQRYLADPYLINKKKFDLRMYVLVTGADPLRVYVHEEGLTRLSTKDYSLKNIKDRFAHLTNYSINKKASNFVAADEGDGSGGGSGGGGAEGVFAGEREGFKWSLKAFTRWLAEQESPAIMQRTMVKIHDLIVKTIIAAEPDLSHSLHTSVNYRTNCFELFGFDVFLDSHLDPHLIEVNISPSLMGSSPLDKRIKGTVISDVCHIVGFQPFDNALLNKYNKMDEKKSNTSSSAKASSTGKTGGTTDVNPFSFSSLSKLMAGQDAWRRDMSVHKLNLKTLGTEDAAWYMMLMIEDEFKRGESSKFQRLHPVPATTEKYLNLYKNPRFSDHMLGKWTLGGLSEGRANAKIIPSRFLRAENDTCETEQQQQRRAVEGIHESPRGSALAVAKSRNRLKSADMTIQKNNATDHKLSTTAPAAIVLPNQDNMIDSDRQELLPQPSPITKKPQAVIRQQQQQQQQPSSRQQHNSPATLTTSVNSRPKSAGRIRPKSGSNYHRPGGHRPEQASGITSPHHTTTNMFDDSIAYDTMQILDVNATRVGDTTGMQSIHDHPPLDSPTAFVVAQQKLQQDRNNNKHLSPRNPPDYLLRTPGQSPRKSSAREHSAARSQSQPPPQPTRPQSPNSRSTLRPKERVKSAKTSKNHPPVARKKSITSTKNSHGHGSTPGEEARSNNIEQVNQKYRPIGKRERRKVKSDDSKGNPLSRDLVNKSPHNTQITTANNIIHYRQQMNSVNVDIYQQLIQRQAEHRPNATKSFKQAKVPTGPLLAPSAPPPAVAGREVAYHYNLTTTTTATTTTSSPPPPASPRKQGAVLLSSTGGNAPKATARAVPPRK